MATNYRIAVIELDDICPRIEPDLPNLYVGVTSRTPDELFDGLSNNKFRPSWARGHVLKPRYDLVPDRCTSLEDARHRKAEHVKGLRRQGFTVNKNTEAYRTYVINLHNPKKTDVGKGYIYVGQTSKSPEDRLQEHLSNARTADGRRLASRVVYKYGQNLNRALMKRHIYLSQEEAKIAEANLAEILEQDGYVVEGGH